MASGVFYSVGHSDLACVSHLQAFDVAISYSGNWVIEALNSAQVTGSVNYIEFPL